MRRRRKIEVWPAFADLMTILSVPGLFLALGLLAVLGNDLKPLERIQELEAQNRELKRQLADLRLLISGPPDDGPVTGPQRRPEARNLAMFRAIQEVQSLIERITGGNLQFSKDQTLQFGDELVSFDLNSVEASWRADGQARLRRFCEALSRHLVGGRSNLGELTHLFAIEIEGHTDSSLCSFDPNCNWTFSSARAVAFMKLMRDESVCPGGASLELLPIGLADTKPLAGPDGTPAVATRRITVRIVPNYQAIIEAVDRLTGTGGP